ncbi:LysE family transporter [Desulfobacterota bacterium AH_259_B03_O07]|nr:LysE family transporter [Desulfobacterota bacterium AH_259_B03_O07]
MMEIGFFFKGFVIGMLIATPVGPVGALCVQSTFTEGKLHGLISGLGATVADVIFGIIAAFGITIISNFLVEQQDWIRLLGGLFICFLGTRIILLEPKKQTDPGKRQNMVSSFLSAFLITLTNPITILTLALMFAGLGLVGQQAQHGSASLMVFGVFIGSSIIWLTLWGISVKFREKFNLSKMALVNRIAGVMIIMFGIVALLSLI